MYLFYSSTTYMILLKKKKGRGEKVVFQTPPFLNGFALTRSMEPCYITSILPTAAAQASRAARATDLLKSLRWGPGEGGRRSRAEAEYVVPYSGHV